MAIYKTWAVTEPMEAIDAISSFEARKLFAIRHRLHVTDCMARRADIDAAMPAERRLQVHVG